jgi:hypothetical protein
MSLTGLPIATDTISPFKDFVFQFCASFEIWHKKPGETLTHFKGKASQK